MRNELQKKSKISLRRKNICVESQVPLPAGRLKIKAREPNRRMLPKDLYYYQSINLYAIQIISRQIGPLMNVQKMNE